MKSLFDLERLEGLGGSDAGSVYNWGFGCSRKTYYQKRQITPDFSKPEAPELERGTMLEPVAKILYEKRTGRKVRMQGVVVSKKYPYMLVHMDGVTTAPEHAGEGYVEFKCVNRFIMKKFKQEGLRDEYILQLQHGMAVTGYQWGSFGILCIDPWDFQWFDVDRDQALIDQLIIDEGILWSKIENGPIPDPLPDAKDKRCASCQWRRTCRADELLTLAPDPKEGDLQTREDLTPLLAEIADLGALKDEATSLYDEARNKLKSEIGDAYGIVAPGYRALMPTSYPERWDTKALEGIVSDAKKALDYTPMDYEQLEMHTSHMMALLKALIKAKKPAKPERSLRIYATGD